MLQPFALVVAAALVAAAPLSPQTVPPGFTVDTLVASNLSGPIDLCFLADGRALIANEDGRVTVFANGAHALVGTVPGIYAVAEAGMLSIAADPAFASNGYLYLWHVSNQGPYARRLERYTCTGDLANPTSTNLAFSAASARVVLDRGNYQTLHHGGSLRFGPDGRLYVSFGDEGHPCDAPDPTTLYGKLLRLDVSTLPAGPSQLAPPYAQLDPGDNPLSGSNDASRLVIATGLRNPVRMEVDRLTGDLHFADVGDSTQEECDQYVRGAGPPLLANFGWPYREGAGPSTLPPCPGMVQPGAKEPLLPLPHAQGWTAAFGGPRYRNGTGTPFAYGGTHEGSVFVADYYDGRIVRIARNGATWAIAAPLAGQPAPDRWGAGFLAITSLHEGPDGALWLTQHSGVHQYTNGGFVRRIRPTTADGVDVVSGDGQFAPAHEPFAAALVVRARGANGSPLASVPVAFTATGGATLTTPNPVLTDANGFAQTTATAGAGGAASVTAALVGTPHDAVFALFARELVVDTAPLQLTITITNASSAPTPLVPMVLLASLPGLPPLSTPFGPVCTPPFHPLTVVLEDSFGLFGSVSLSGSGAIGTPALTRVYAVPTAVLAGLSLQFQAVGLDPLDGLFRTNCTLTTF